jgi:hypothetical protein
MKKCPKCRVVPITCRNSSVANGWRERHRVECKKFHCRVGPWRETLRAAIAAWDKRKDVVPRKEADQCRYD